MLKQSMAPRRSSFSLRSQALTGLVAAAALAVAAFLGSQEGLRPGALATAFAQGHEQTGREMPVLPAQDSEAPLPEIYRHIRPVGINGESPPIPSAETWPAP